MRSVTLCHVFTHIAHRAHMPGKWHVVRIFGLNIGISPLLSPTWACTAHKSHEKYIFLSYFYTMYICYITTKTAPNSLSPSEMNDPSSIFFKFDKMPPLRKVLLKYPILISGDPQSRVLNSSLLRKLRIMLMYYNTKV